MSTIGFSAEERMTSDTERKAIESGVTMWSGDVERFGKIAKEQGPAEALVACLQERGVLLAALLKLHALPLPDDAARIVKEAVFGVPQSINPDGPTCHAPDELK